VAIPTRPYDGAAERGSVAVLNGDLTADRFGLDEAASREIAAGLDLIVHCAAVTAFNLTEADYDRVNVGGTAQVLAFAGQACAAVGVLHVSTAYVCGVADGVVEEVPTTATRFNNGYEASKAAAEELVLAAHRHGQQVAIARPSIVTGSSQDGRIGVFGNLYQFIRFVAEGRIGALPMPLHASLNMVPIDYVVAGMIDIAERMTAADGRIFHLAASEPVLLTLFEALAAEFPHLAAPCFVSPEGFDTARLSPRQQWLHAQMMAPYDCYFRPSPSFVTANLQSLSGRRCSPSDGAYVRRLISYAIETGFLQGASGLPTQRTSG
jgi:thioester reductase-like protein